MFKTQITPQFAEVGAMGYINNNIIGNWFEVGRNDIFRFFSPNLDVSNNWNLILLKTHHKFISHIIYNDTVEIKTYVSHIGNTSFTLYHEAWQNKELKAKGEAVLVHFDFKKQIKKPIPPDIRTKLEKHFK